MLIIHSKSKNMARVYSNRKVWVKPFTRSDGTRVKGYYRNVNESPVSDSSIDKSGEFVSIPNKALAASFRNILKEKGYKTKSGRGGSIGIIGTPEELKTRRGVLLKILKGFTGNRKLK